MTTSLLSEIAAASVAPVGKRREPALGVIEKQFAVLTASLCVLISINTIALILLLL
ncbi:MAG: hypothetical protein IEMM0002_0756 [bacterium]|nr:MAG: hypothetical protein IEMM0002_0756 [bacterium]